MRVGLLVVVLAAVAAGCGSSSDEESSTTSTAPPASAISASELAPVHGPYSPQIEPANFASEIDNQWFPLEPGTGFHYKGVAEDGKTPQTDDMTVTDQTKGILGVTCTVVRDVVSSHGRPIERTFDWYAQDQDGNVWYMGEDSRELEHGKFVKQDDSWEAGVDGRSRGSSCPAIPSGETNIARSTTPASRSIRLACWEAAARSRCRPAHTTRRS